jgi:hypothetical protein
MLLIIFASEKEKAPESITFKGFFCGVNVVG